MNKRRTTSVQIKVSKPSICTYNKSPGLQHAMDPVMMQNEGRPVYGNIMYDRRVVRGSSYPKCILPDKTAKCRAPMRTGAKDRFQRRRPVTPEGRTHIAVQTELYLEQLSDQIESANVDGQTDALLDRPTTPLFIPAKTGTDTATQIEEGELFDFDLEVQPMLEVLVGKTIEQALLEVLEEEELARLRAQQRISLELRNAELVEVQRLEEEERRHSEEKARRIKQQQMILQKEKETAEKMAARTFAQQYLADLLPSVLTNLRDHGYFYDPVERDIETGYLPWMMVEVSKTLEGQQVARTVLDMMIQEVIDQRWELFRRVVIN